MTLSGADLYRLVLSALTYLQDDGGQFRRGVDKAGLSRDEFWLLNRFRYFPGSVAPADFLTFGPYASVSIYTRLLDELAAKKFAETVDAGRYRSSETGRRLIDTLYRDYFNAIARHDRLPEPDVQRLGALADRAVAAALRQREVPTPIISAARSTFPASDQPWVYAERRVVAMAVFHEDAHVAAWREDGWSGPRITVSTALFKTAEPLTAAQLREAAERLDDKDYQSAVAALHAAGEISQPAADRYQLTKAGREARQAVEDATDHYYERLLQSLDPIEGQELVALLEKICGPR